MSQYIVLQIALIRRGEEKRCMPPIVSLGATRGTLESETDRAPSVPLRTNLSGPSCVMNEGRVTLLSREDSN